MQVIDEEVKWSSHLTGQFEQLSLTVTRKIQVDATRCEPITSTIPLQCSKQLNYEAAQLGACVPVKRLDKLM